MAGTFHDEASRWGVPQCRSGAHPYGSAVVICQLTRKNCSMLLPWCRVVPMSGSVRRARFAVVTRCSSGPLGVRSATPKR